MKIFRSETLVYHTPHEIDHCLALLEDAVDLSSRPMSSVKKVFGAIIGDDMVLKKNHRMHNSFQPVLRGSLTPTDHGTAVFASVGWPTSLKVFLILLFAGVAVFGGASTVYHLYALIVLDAAFDPAVIASIGIPMAMALGGWVLVTIATAEAQGDGACLQRFVVDLLEAEVVARPEDLTGLRPRDRSRIYRVEYT